MSRVVPLVLLTLQDTTHLLSIKIRVQITYIYISNSMADFVANEKHLHHLQTLIFRFLSFHSLFSGMFKFLEKVILSITFAASEKLTRIAFNVNLPFPAYFATNSVLYFLA